MTLFSSQDIGKPDSCRRIRFFKRRPSLLPKGERFNIYFIFKICSLWFSSSLVPAVIFCDLGLWAPIFEKAALIFLCHYKVRYFTSISYQLCLNSIFFPALWPICHDMARVKIKTCLPSPSTQPSTWTSSREPHHEDHSGLGAFKPQACCGLHDFQYIV